MLVISKKAFIAAIAFAVISVVAAIVLCCIPISRKKLSFSAEFYYVCYEAPSDSQSASSVSGLVRSYGGGGYVVSAGGKYYVTMACYYSDEDAQIVCNSLNGKGLQCFVLDVTAGGYEIRGSVKKNKALYEGNLNTLLSVSKLCYNLANSMDRNETLQQGARAILSDVQSALDGLLSKNRSNCFTATLNSLKEECADAAEGYVFSADVRRLQTAVCDSMVNLNIY